jgi:hypothetical protein
MTPYAVWSESRSEIPDVTDTKHPGSFGVEYNVEFEEELAGLIEEVIENLMGSSAAELRKVFELMQRSREEKRQRDQNAFWSKELARIEEKTTAIVAEALVPVLADLQRSRVVAEFASTLKKILPEFGGHLITINAPMEFHDRISHALKLQSVEAEIHMSDKAEILVAGSHVVLRADLDQWAKRLSEVATV